MHIVCILLASASINSPALGGFVRACGARSCTAHWIIQYIDISSDRQLARCSRTLLIVTGRVAPLVPHQCAGGGMGNGRVGAAISVHLLSRLGRHLFPEWVRHWMFRRALSIAVLVEYFGWHTLTRSGVSLLIWFIQFPKASGVQRCVVDRYPYSRVGQWYQICRGFRLPRREAAIISEDKERWWITHISYTLHGKIECITVYRL